VWFRAISLPHVTHSENGCRGAYKHEFLPPEPFLRFSQRTCPNHYFRSKTHVWCGFVQFRCRTLPIPKTGVGVHTSTSFCHRNHFFVFHNEHAHSTTLGPKLMFGVVLHNFVAARHSFRKRVSGCIQRLSFRHRNHFFVFRNKHAQSTTLGPKLMFGVVSRNFFAARHPFRKRVSGCIQSTSFFPPEPFLRFSQQTCPIHYSRSKTHVWGGFSQFRCRTSPIPKTGVGVHTKQEFLPPEPFFLFSQRTCPIQYFRSKTHVWGGFTQLRCRTSRIPKTGVGVHTKQEFLPPEPFLRFSQRTYPIHYFRSKTHVWVGFAQFRCRTLPIPKTIVGGAYKA
jgi:RNA polymerase subunit RPABC4/transcription elongation factor Spt4